MEPVGYEAAMIFHNVVIPEQNVEACLRALNRLYEGWGLGAAGRQGYDTLAAALAAREIRAVAYDTTGRGRVVELRAWESERWEADRYVPVFRAIAPYVDDEYASITVLGEDEALWRYAFQDGTVIGQRGIASWRDDPFLTS